MFDMGDFDDDLFSGTKKKATQVDLQQVIDNYQPKVVFAKVRNALLVDVLNDRSIHNIYTRPKSHSCKRPKLVPSWRTPPTSSKPKRTTTTG